jgi:hypothetical protein
MKLLSATLLLLFAQDKIELRWKWQKGQELVYKSSNKTLMEFGGQPIDQQMGYTYSMTVTDVSDGGEATIQVKYLAVVAKGVGPAGEFDYDSEKDKEAPKEGAAALQARMIGQSYTMKMNAQGRVTEVKGYDKVLEAMMKGVGDEAGPMKAQLKQLFNNDVAKGMMQRQVPPFPEGRVGKGDSWTNDFVVKMPMVGGLKFAMKAKLAELQDDSATIAQDVQVGMVGAEENSDNPLAGLMEIKNGAVKGTAVFSTAKGCMLSQTAALDMKIAFGGGEMPIKSIVELKLVSRK